MSGYQAESRVKFPIGLHCGVGGKLVSLGPGERIAVSLEYIHTEEFIKLMDKHWVRIVFPWEEQMSVLEAVEQRKKEKPKPKPKKKTRKRKKKPDAVQEQSSTEMGVRDETTVSEEVVGQDEKLPETPGEGE